LEIWKGIAFAGFVALAAAFFMPWITGSGSIFGSSYGLTYSMLDLWKDIMALHSMA
jgi:hypothetical protein